MAVGASAGRYSSRWSRSYPPLLVLAVAVLVAALILPSSLNIPNSNPSTVLEYAPVPPEDDSPTPPEGNVSSLGLGSSSSLSSGGLPPPPPPADRGTGSRPQTKKCVGNPPRQTEDPMSPPCVPFFEGDNFGRTWQGVTEDEILVLVYFDVGAPDGETSPVAGTAVDFDDPPKPACPKTWPASNPNRAQCDDLWIRLSRAFNRYFNDRFQTYRRRVHYIAYFTGASTAAARRSDAAELWNRYRPFAVLDQATFNGFNEDFTDAMAARDVLVFSSRTALPNSFFRKNAPQAWGYWPDIERWSANYSDFVCRRVKPFNSSHAGHPQGTGILNNRPRKIGLWYTTDPKFEGLRLFRELVKERLRACGAIDDSTQEGSYSSSGFIVDNGDNGSEAGQAVARFQAAQVTTVLYLGGMEGKFSQAADAAKYYPEIVFAADLDLGNNQTARLQNPNVWHNAWGTSFQLRIDSPEDTQAYRAYKATYPNGQRSEARLAYDTYSDHFMLFQAIQVAGPRLNPESIDQGFHAIPPKAHTDAYIASFFFDPGDYTSIKDQLEMFWDPTGQSPGHSDPGCYRLVNGGIRYLTGRWPNSDQAFAPNSPCTGFEGGRPINPNP